MGVNLQLAVRLNVGRDGVWSTLMHELLVDVGARKDDSALLRFAFALARQHRASVTGIQVVTLDALAFALPEALLVLEDETRQARERHDWWMTLCKRHGVSGSWEVVRGFYQSAMARSAVFADIVLGGLDNHHPRASDTIALLGRSLLAEAVPMLLVPEQWDGSGRVRRIVMAWNGTVESARAIRASYPLLSRASEVIVLDGEDAEDAGDGQVVSTSRLPLRKWLRHRSINASWHTCAESSDPGPFIHRFAQESDADLIVMGAWGHSRLGEWLLGGVTRYMLGNSQIPLLMAH